jgi:hypothetical protein
MVKIYKQRVFLQYSTTFLTIVTSLFVSMNNGRNIETKMTGLFFILVGILYIITQTKYIIEGDKLLLKIGKITENTIEINKIETISLVKVRFVKSPKLVIKTGRYNKFAFFPIGNDIDDFIKDIQHKNPNISVCLT